MIADTAVLSTSPWQVDAFIPKDLFKFGVESDAGTLERDIAALEAEIERVHRQKEQTLEMRRMKTGLHSTSCSTSVASSECSDEPYIDIESNLDDNLFNASEDQEYLGHTLLNTLLEDANVTDTVHLSSFDWADSEMDASLGGVTEVLSDSQSDIIPSLPSSPLMSRKRSHSESFKEHRPWSRLSNSEQIAVVEDLSRIISNEMGLREQLEVIRIINPTASVTAADTEFIIDLDCLNDEKLQRVREYVKQHSRSHTSSDNCSSSECGSPVQKKPTKKQRKTQQRELRQRQRKEYRQMLKEKRSGLFAKEEVLSLSNCDPQEIDEVDILE